MHEGARASDAPSRAHHIERRRLCARDRSLLVQLPLRNQREQPCLHFRRLGEPLLGHKSTRLRSLHGESNCREAPR
jgi:hypothetical protein